MAFISVSGWCANLTFNEWLNILILAQNTDQQYFELSRDMLFWEDFHAELTKHSNNNINSFAEWTKSAIPNLHQLLLSGNHYLDILTAAKNEIIKNYNLSIPLFKNERIKINVIAIEEGCGLPLHDHPGSSGIAFVISGKVHLTVCETEEPKNSPNNLLTVTDERIISKGDVSCFTADRNNIHGMESKSPRSVLLIIHSPPFEKNSQSFFFPITDLGNAHSPILTQRMQAQTIHNFRKKYKTA